MKPEQRTATTASTAKYRFKKHDTIGNASAESDGNYLSSCFVDNGTLDLLRDCSDQRGIVLGRTGSGKTALLKKLVTCEERAIALDLDALSLGYISNSTLINFLESLGVKMDVFYRALWRHVLVVKILQRYFEFTSEQDRADPWDVLKYKILRKKSHLDALEYLKNDASDFWITTQKLIEEETIKTDTELRAKTHASLHNLVSMGAEGARRLTTEQHAEMRQIGQEVINHSQMEKLAALFEALDDELLRNSQRRYFIVIDRLDEDWVDDPVRYRLIKALIETMRDFNSKVRHAKVILAIRVDLFDRVLRATADAAFQAEKYRDLCVQVTWTPQELGQILDTRINHLIQNHYAGHQVVGLRDIMPRTVGSNREDPLQFMVDRTLMRPRDVIEFFNACIVQAEGTTDIHPKQLTEAEEVYSESRLEALANEWSVQYPHLRRICGLLTRKPAHFRLDTITDSDLIDLCARIVDSGCPEDTQDYQAMKAFTDCQITSSALRQHIAQVLFETGAIGLKVASYRNVAWCYTRSDRVSNFDISDSSTAHIHKMLWRALGINPS